MTMTVFKKGDVVYLKSNAEINYFLAKGVSLTEGFTLMHPISGDTFWRADSQSGVHLIVDTNEIQIGRSVLDWEGDDDQCI